MTEFEPGTLAAILGALPEGTTLPTVWIPTSAVLKVPAPEVALKVPEPAAALCLQDTEVTANG
jgi:hypothetical protein